MVEQTLLIDAEKLERIKSGFHPALIARREDGTIMEYAKCELLSSNEASDKTSELLSEVYKYLKKDSVDKASVRNILKDYKNGMKNLSGFTENLSTSIENLGEELNSIEALSYINIGLTMANIAVDVAGFVIINKKLNELNNQIQDVSTRLGILEDLEKNKIIREYKGFALDYNSLLTKISHNEPVELDHLEKFVNIFYTYLDELIGNYWSNAINTDVFLMIINTLMPAYTLITCELIDRHYFDRGIIPSNYESYIGLFDRLMEPSYAKRLEEYFFYEKKLNTIYSMDAVNTEILLALNGKTQLEDQVEIVKELKTKDKVDEFKSVMKEHAKQVFNKMCDELYSTSEIWRENYHPVAVTK